MGGLGRGVEPHLREDGPGDPGAVVVGRGIPYRGQGVSGDGKRVGDGEADRDLEFAGRPRREVGQEAPDLVVDLQAAGRCGNRQLGLWRQHDADHGGGGRSGAGVGDADTQQGGLSGLGLGIRPHQTHRQAGLGQEEDLQRDGHTPPGVSDRERGRAVAQGCEEPRVVEPGHRGICKRVAGASARVAQLAHRAIGVGSQHGQQERHAGETQVQVAGQDAEINQGCRGLGGQ